ncbi:DOHH [Cordylochernes scorpioides]|uniref:DOHH n=1 Tax=Cordylochernes scorpioides TaxID=51811 RepID=A0ABY6K4Y3_9ARAC|nr:DOHH [Cordylochernes scorpioides]
MVELRRRVSCNGFYHKGIVAHKLCVAPAIYSTMAAQVAETCQLAIERIRWQQHGGSDKERLPNNPFLSVDPAPPLAEQDVESLKSLLVDSTQPLFQRYRAMFALRNLATSEAAQALAEGLYCADSALFRHEIAYVLGQLQDETTADALSKVLADPNESPMVRHECAEAMGSIATPQVTVALRNFLGDPEDVVRESCEVALDISDYNTSAEFQYADPLAQAV